MYPTQEHFQKSSKLKACGKGDYATEKEQKRSSHCLGLLQQGIHYIEGPLWKQAERTERQKHEGPRLPWGKFLPEFKSGEWFNSAYMKAEQSGARGT